MDWEEKTVVSVIDREAVFSSKSQRPVVGEKDALLARRLLEDLMRGYSGPVAIRLWNGDTVIGDERARCTLVFRRASDLRELILRRNLLRTAEAYIAGAIEVHGSLESLFSLSDFLVDANWSMRQKFRAVRDAWRLPNRRSEATVQAPRAKRVARSNSRESISHHYDVGNDFYRLWLDPEMVYSCAYFRDSSQSLADAQQDKLDYLCRKLRLAPGQHLLDIGCGWGALVLWAARHYGVRAHGITLSEQQYEHANARICAEGMAEQVTVELRDYRDLSAEARYDRVVSVGMFEHIGLRNFDGYFQTVKRVLKPGGLFLNHGITSDTGWQRTPLTRFINCHIFPDGELTRISEVCTAMERAGFELLDVESLRRHYALTLRRWVEALEVNHNEAVEAASEAVYRLWRLYMSGSAYYFGEGSINVYQILGGHARSPVVIPLRRDDLYLDRRPERLG